MAYTTRLVKAVAVGWRYHEQVFRAMAFAYLGLGLIYGGSAQALKRDSNFETACGIIVGHMAETSFSALVAVAAGLGAIIASAVGGFKAAWLLLFVSVSCFILRPLLTLVWDPGNCTTLA